MQYRRFGKTDLTVSEVGFGAARIGGIFQGLSRDDYRRALRKALDAGINFFDTADMYCNGESEEILGEAFAGVRDRVVIASKAGYCVPRQRHMALRIKPLLRPIIRFVGIKRHHLPASVRGTLSQDFSPDYLVKSVEGSLKRLRTDYLDLFQLHSPPASVLATGEFLAPLERLKAEGKIRYFGVSCELASDAAICLQYPSINALQLQVSLLATEALQDVIPRAAASGLGVIARECLGGGLLAKPLDGLGLENIISDAAERVALQDRLTALSAAATQQGCSLRQFAQQFVLNQEGISVALFGMRTEEHVSSNLRMLGPTRP